MALPKMTSPKGTARFPKLIEPDEYKGKKQYKVDLVMPAADAKDLEAKLSDHLAGFVEQKRMELEEAVEAAGNARDKKKAETALAEFEAAPRREILHEDFDAEGNPTGNLFAKFNTNYSSTNRKTGEEVIRKVPFFDAATPPKKTEPASVGQGSELRINFSPSCYYLGGFKGVSLKINAVQIINLAGDFGNASADELGFEGEDGGFVASETPSTPEPAVAAPVADDGNPDF